MSNAVYLTKSRHTAGLQCLRRLWLNVHEPADWEEPESGSAENVGLEIGRMAHLLFPGGILVEEKPWEHAAAVARTARLLADGPSFAAQRNQPRQAILIQQYEAKWIAVTVN